MAIQDKPNSNRKPKPASVSKGPPTATSASAWRKQASEGTPLVVPSGNTCLVRASSGLDMFVRNGSIPNTLMPIIQDAMSKGKAPTIADLNLETTPELLASILELTDTSTIFMVMEPVVVAIPLMRDEACELVLDKEGKTQVVPFSQRDQGDFIYVDEVSFEDKMFIFNWAVGGTADLEKFRKELGSSLEPVPGS